MAILKNNFTKTLHDRNTARRQNIQTAEQHHDYFFKQTTPQDIKNSDVLTQCRTSYNFFFTILVPDNDGTVRQYDNFLEIQTIRHNRLSNRNLNRIIKINP